MKAQGKILILTLAAFLICGMGWALLGRREPWARIQFTKARYSNDGALTIAYDCKVSSGVFLHETEFENGEKTGEGGSGGNSLFGWPNSASSDMSIDLSPSDIATPPSLLVETGRNYILKLHDELPLYDFTNKSGVRYQGRLRVEQFQ